MFDRTSSLTARAGDSLLLNVTKANAERLLTTKNNSY